MSADTIISRLDGAKQRGKDRWSAKCPAHTDKSASLSIKQADDGRVLIHCFAGCDAHAIMQSVGLEMTDLMPESMGNLKGFRRSFDAYGALKAVSFEMLVIKLIAKKLKANEPLTDDDRQRAGRAETVINDALNAVEGVRKRA